MKYSKTFPNIIIWFLTLFIFTQPLSADATKHKKRSRTTIKSKHKKKKYLQSSYCPKGYHRYAWKYCIKNECPNGAIKKGKYCVCKKGFKWNKNGKNISCVPTHCPKGKFRGSDGNCYCPGGYRYLHKLKKCVLTKCPKGQYLTKNYKCKSKCIKGFKWNKKQRKCISIKKRKKLKCPKGQVKVLGKNYCVHLKCPRGTIRSSKTKICIPKHCPKGKRPSKFGIYCVKKRCSKKEIRSSKTDKCELPLCPNGFVRPLGKTYCVRRKCPTNSKRAKNGKCICNNHLKMIKAGYCVPVHCGKYAYRASDHRCYPCPKGKYRPKRLGYCVSLKCPKKTFRNKKTMKCQCPKGLRFSKNHQYCVAKKCNEGEIRNSNTDKCICKKGFVKFANISYCVPSNCGKYAYRASDYRCYPCPKGKYRPKGTNKCFWEPCPKGQKRGENGICKGKLHCKENEKLALNKKRCVPKYCPIGTRRDPITEQCIKIKKNRKRKQSLYGFKNKFGVFKETCKISWHKNAHNKCVPDECSIGKIRDKNEKCVIQKCPLGYKKNKKGVCIAKKCPKGTKRSKFTGACIAPHKRCPYGTFENPYGKCIPSPCPKGFARPSDNMGKCIKISTRKIRCKRGKIKNYQGKCVKKRYLNCPKGFKRIGNRCFYL